ncbi:helix-turn-helix domain-containing protein [Aliarcobacter butzleri]|uniref:helix-turn-helix domain-containing protein n=1 Tax=Aliarcobacter butzleri TaxID=28197 RepID=UPI00344BC70B
MKKQQFNKTLKEVGLSQKEFAEILGVAQQTVNSWGTTQNIPYWVETWLENYEKAKFADKLIQTFLPLIDKKEIQKFKKDN